MSIILKSIISAFIFWFSFSCYAGENQDNGSMPIGVSIINLIANPERYHNKKIRFIGFASVEFENFSIYLSKESYDNRMSLNAIWLDLESKNSTVDSIMKKIHGLIKLDKHYVIVEGVFDKNDKGHMSMNSGSINGITRLDKWDSRSK